MTLDANTTTDTIALVLVLIGALLCLTASIGLLRFRDCRRVCTPPPSLRSSGCC